MTIRRTTPSFISRCSCSTRTAPICSVGAAVRASKTACSSSAANSSATTAASVVRPIGDRAVVLGDLLDRDLLQPRLEDQVVGRRFLVDACRGLLAERAHAGTQFVVEVGRRLLHPGGETFLPPARPGTELGDACVQLAQVVDRLRRRLLRALGPRRCVHRQRQQSSDVGDVLAGVAQPARSRRLPDRAVDRAEQLGEAGLVLQALIARRQRPQVQRRRHHEQLDVTEAGAVEVAAVARGDPRRCGVQVQFGHHAEQGRAALAGGGEVGELGRRQLLAAVGDEQDAVDVLQRGEVQRARRRFQPADAGCVDEQESGGEDPPGEGDLDPPHAEMVGRVPGLAADAADLDELGVGCAVAAVVDQHGEPLAVAHDDGGDGRVDGVGRADVGVDEGVDQARLALLELADDGNGDAGADDPLATRLEAGGEVVTTRPLGELDDGGQRLGRRDVQRWRLEEGAGRGEGSGGSTNRRERRCEQCPATGARPRAIVVAGCAVRTGLHPVDP